MFLYSYVGFYIAIPISKFLGSRLEAEIYAVFSFSIIQGRIGADPIVNSIQRDAYKKIAHLILNSEDGDISSKTTYSSEMCDAFC